MHNATAIVLEGFLLSIRDATRRALGAATPGSQEHQILTSLLQELTHDLKALGWDDATVEPR